MKIPKIIHQTITSKDSLHPRFWENIEEIRALNPDWEYRLYDEQDRRNFIQEHYGDEYCASYDRIRPEYGAAKADFFRYLLIYKVGGVYLDVKSSTRRPLSDVIGEDDDFILSHWNQADFPGFGLWPQYGVDHEYQQWHVIARPGHPFLQAVIERVKYNIDHYDPLRNGIGREGVILATGPIPYTVAISRCQEEHSFRQVDAQADLGLVFSFLREQGINHSDLMGNNYRKRRTALTRESVPVYRMLLAILNRKLKLIPRREASSSV